MNPAKDSVMRAVALEALDRVSVVDLPAPDPAGRALLSVDRVGICGTDVGIVRGKIPVALPRVLCHEVVATVIEAGSAGHLAPGARVLVNPTTSCDTCTVCLADRDHLCPDGALMGRDVDGGAAELLAVPETHLLHIPERISDDAAALLQVLGTCVHAQTQFALMPDDVAVVVGLGVSGLLMLQLLRARGARRVVAVTRSPWKAELARGFGALAVAGPEEAPETVGAIAGERGATVVIEAAGTVETLAQAVGLAGLGACVVAFGVVAGPATVDELPLYDLYYKELTVRWPRAARQRDYARAIGMVADGVVDPAPLVTATFPLDDAQSAFAAVAESRHLKVTMTIG